METFQHNGRFHVMETEKFKDVTCSIRFLGKNEEPYVSMRNLLAQILIDRSEHYPKKSDIAAVCDACYGLNVDSKTTAYGKAHGLEFRFKTISDRYAQDKPFEKAVAFIADLLRFPLINEATLSEAKTNVLASLLRYEDNPSQYAMIQACGLAGEAYPLSVFSQGKKEVVEAIGVDQLQQYYRDLIEADRFDCFAVGDFDAPEMINTLRDAFSFLDEHNEIDSAYALDASEFRSGHTQRDIEQTNLIRLYTIHRDVLDEKYTAHRLAVVMLGQLPNSLLFREVREARSLCYSIYSGMVQFDGVVSVSTGIDAQKKEEVERLIEAQIDVLRLGDFEPKLLQTAKDMMVSSIKSAGDDATSIINFHHQRILTRREETFDSAIAKIMEVKFDEITEAVATWTPIVSYTVGLKEGQ